MQGIKVHNARDIVYNLDLFSDGPEICHEEAKSQDLDGFQNAMRNFYSAIGFGKHSRTDNQQKVQSKTSAKVSSKAFENGFYESSKSEPTTDFLTERENSLNSKELDAGGPDRQHQVRGVAVVGGNLVELTQKQGRKRYRCVVCDHERSSRDSVLAHVRIEHEKVSPMSCQLCPFKTHNFESLRRHDCRTVFQCKYCGRKVSSQQSLTNHAAVHASPKFKCELCGKGLKQKQGLKRHMKSHHIE